MGNNKMVWDEKIGKMVNLTAAKGEVVKISISEEQAEALKSYALEDGYDFSGISYITQKDADGKTKKDKDGKPIFVLENGKPKTITVEESTAKVNSAVSDYVTVAVKMLMEKRGNQSSSSL